MRRLALLPVQEWDTLAAASFWVALALALLAFARPQWGEVTENVQRLGLDIVVCLDTSRSMDVTDVSPSRLDAPAWRSGPCSPLSKGTASAL